VEPGPAQTSGAAPTRPQPSTAALREAWTEQREFLIATASDIAAGLRGFWMFEEVPAALREEPPVLYPAGEAEAVREARDGLITRRRAWLLEHRPEIDR